MKSLIVKLYIKEESIEDFKKISAYNSENSRKEPGCLRFDVLQSEETPTMFFLYEIYKGDDDIAHHRTTEHYQKWRDTVADMMSRPREVVKAVTLCPAEESAYKSN
jgi:autoinducer 2-degrading protein